MNNIKLILLDMDGTLLKDDDSFPDEFYEVLMELKHRDILVGIASGRNAKTIEVGFGTESFMNMVCITGNGTASYIDGKNISLETLAISKSKEILQIAQSFKDCSIALMYPTHYFIKPDNSFIDFYERKEIDLKYCTDFDAHLEGVTGISIMDNKRENSHFLDKLKHLEGQVHFTDSGFGCVDCVESYVSKAYGIKKVIEHLHISYDQIMAIGDALNDYELLRVVGVPVAMKNGISEIKEISKYVTDYSNNENGCLKFLKKFFQLETILND